jgi:NAD(P)-dependent dehydrogenase (short-subunit alcohol dehydrogenase family)
MSNSKGRKVWFITGASRGFGALIAAEALAAGDAVVAAARDPASVTARLGEQANLLAVRLDVTQEEQAQEAVKQALKKFGRIDVLVNNAGYGLLGGIEESSAEEVERLYATNVFGLLKVTRAVLPQMRQQRSGHVINLSSVGGYRAGAGFGVYCSTKFAVEGLSEGLAAELASLGVKVTVVEPGYFRTDFLDRQSLGRVGRHIADYDASVGATRQLASDRNHAQQGDPAKLARVMIELANAKQPPLRLPLGSDTVAAIEAKNEFVAGELKQWRAVALSTDFPAAA